VQLTQLTSLSSRGCDKITHAGLQNLAPLAALTPIGW